VSKRYKAPGTADAVYVADLVLQVVVCVCV
jgi:hypothetical protein